MAAEPRVVVVHAEGPDLHRDGAHCFGPFDSEAEAVAFEKANPDSCHRFIVVIVGPDPDDVARTADGEPVPARTH